MPPGPVLGLGGFSMLWSILHEVVKIKFFFVNPHKNSRNNIGGGGLFVSFELRTTTTGGGSGSGSGGSGSARQGDPPGRGLLSAGSARSAAFVNFKQKRLC